MKNVFKIITSSLFVFLFLTSCNNTNQRKLSDEERKSIKSSIEEILNENESLWKTDPWMNIEKIISLRSEKWDLIIQGKKYSKEEFIEMMRPPEEDQQDYEFSFKNNSIDIEVLNRSAAIVLIDYNGIATDSLNNQKITPVMLTFVFKKMNEGWKIIHEHESFVKQD